MRRQPPRSTRTDTLVPYTTRFRSQWQRRTQRRRPRRHRPAQAVAGAVGRAPAGPLRDRRRRAGLAGRARLGLSGWIRVVGPEAARGNLLVHGRKHTDVRHKDVPPSPSNAALHRAHVQCGAVEPRHQVTVKSQLRALIAQGIDALRAAGTLPADLATPDLDRKSTRLNSST